MTENNIIIPPRRQFPADEVLHEQFFPDPDRHRMKKAFKPFWREGMISFKEPLEFEERLFIKSNGRHRFRCDSRFLENVVNRPSRKSGIMLLSGKPLLLGSRDDLAVNDNRCGTVVIISRYAQN